MIGIKYVSMEGGYGVAAERTVAALAATGVPLTWAPMQRGPSLGSGWEPSTSRVFGPPALHHLCNRPIAFDTVIVHTVPDHYPAWARLEAGKRLIGYTTWETTRLPPEWAAWLPAMDSLVVPCTENVAVVRSVFAGDVGVVPHPCDPAPLPAARRRGDEFCFSTIGVWSTRKNLADLVTAFCRAFTVRDRVRLLVKTSPGDLTRRRWPWCAPGRLGRAVRRFLGAGHVPVERTVAALCARFPEPPPVELITHSLTDEEIRALHARGDAFVSLTRGEGWGLGAFDAASHGRPVIMTGFGGQLDYLDSERSWLVDYDLEPCRIAENDLWGGYKPDQRWARPRLEHAVRQMQAVRRDPEAARKRAAALAAELQQRFSPQRIAARWLELLVRDAPPSRRSAWP